MYVLLLELRLHTGHIHHLSALALAHRFLCVSLLSLGKGKEYNQLSLIHARKRANQHILLLPDHFP